MRHEHGGRRRRREVSDVPLRHRVSCSDDVTPIRGGLTMRAVSFVAMAVMATLCAASRVAAQIALPVKSYQSLNVQIESLRDNITLYRGDPQHLLLMDVRPNRFRPRVDYFDQSDAGLRIRDQYVVDHPDYDSQTPADRDKSGDAPLEETWEMRLSPVAPTDFAVRCERGESSLDFTDFEVRKVQLRADETKLSVEFDGQNSIECERFAARVIAGSLEFKHMINVRAKEISLDLPNSACRLEIAGKEFEGESSINVLSVPATLQVLVSKKVGLRVTGPAATIAHFKDAHMGQSGDDWVSQGYDSAKCKVHLTFGSEIPKLAVKWE
jgi:hypothetical protein